MVTFVVVTAVAGGPGFSGVEPGSWSPLELPGPEQDPGIVLPVVTTRESPIFRICIFGCMVAPTRATGAPLVGAPLLLLGLVSSWGLSPLHLLRFSADLDLDLQVDLDRPRGKLRALLELLRPRVSLL